MNAGLQFARMPRLLTALIATAAVLVPAAPAAAGPPPGDWTYLRHDVFRHYACKAKGADEGRWRVRTATWVNGHQDAIDQGIGAYAALARGGNDDVARQQDSTAWNGGYVRMTLRGALRTDRLWVQGSYYGPAEPWSDGVRVSRIRRC